MKIQVRSFVVLGSALFFVSCAHHRDVRPGADGIHRVSVHSEERGSAERSALSQANHYCEELGGKHPGIIEEKTKYTGSMDEETRDTVRKASTAAILVGGAGGVGGHGNVRRGGVGLGTAGTVGHVMTGGDNYLTEMSFKCQ